MDVVTHIDLAESSVRDVNRRLHNAADLEACKKVEILHPDGQHSIAAGMRRALSIDIRGHAGYFCAGMNMRASVTVHGNVGWSVAENMMSGDVRVAGHASECAGASAHGGLLVIEGNASSRCGISMKGSNIVVGGDVGHFSAFMAQAGTLVICGDAGDNLGDSLYEATIYVRGKITSLGADAQQEEMQDADRHKVAELLRQAKMDADLAEFKRVASARKLYHWNSHVQQDY